jgi:hypothetical protein
VSAASIIVDRLAEYLGQQAAQSTVNTFCRKVGVAPEALSASQLSLLLPTLRPLLQILLGTTRAEAVLSQLGKDLAS